MKYFIKKPSVDFLNYLEAKRKRDSLIQDYVNKKITIETLIENNIIFCQPVKI